MAANSPERNGSSPYVSWKCSLLTITFSNLKKKRFYQIFHAFLRNIVKLLKKGYISFSHGVDSEQFRFDTVNYWATD